jgi:hypothetical protein
MTARLGDDEIARLEADAIALGHAMFVIDLSGAEDKAALLERTATALRFPAWFGHNWDAWFDCLADLAWLAPAPGYVLLLRRAGGLRRSAPEVSDTALAIAEDVARVWAGRGVSFTVYVDVDTDR